MTVEPKHILMGVGYGLLFVVLAVMEPLHGLVLFMPTLLILVPRYRKGFHLTETSRP